MVGQGDAAFDEARTFGFKQSALQAGVGLADGDASAGGDDAVPGNALTAGRRGHSTSGGTSAARQPHRASELAVCDDAALGDALNQRVEAAPGGIHVSNIAWSRDICDGLEVTEIPAARRGVPKIMPG